MMDNETRRLPAAEDVRVTVRRFIVDMFLFGTDSTELENGTSFLQSGIIDSTGILELIHFVEKTYGIRVAESEMIPQYLDSLDNIARYVTSKCAEPS